MHAQVRNLNVGHDGLLSSGNAPALSKICMLSVYAVSPSPAKSVNVSVAGVVVDLNWPVATAAPEATLAFVS